MNFAKFLRTLLQNTFGRLLIYASPVRFEVYKFPVDTGRKLNVHKTFTSSERLMYVQFASCVYVLFISGKLIVCFKANMLCFIKVLAALWRGIMIDIKTA